MMMTGAAGENNHGLDIGFVQSVKLGNYTWFETDDNGDATDNATPLSNTLITVEGPNGMVYTTTTNADGLYLVCVAANTKYTVTAQPAIAVLPSGTLIPVDNDPNTNNNLSHDPFGTMVMIGTEDNMTIDFGFKLFDPTAISMVEASAEMTQMAAIPALLLFSLLAITWRLKRRATVKSQVD